MHLRGTAPGKAHPAGTRLVRRATPSPRASARTRLELTARPESAVVFLFLGFFFLKPQGKSETEQLDLIFKLCGTPSAEDWPGLHSLPWAKTILPTKKAYPRRVQEVFRRAPPSARCLVERFLTLDPERVTARDARWTRTTSGRSPCRASPGTCPSTSPRTSSRPGRGSRRPPGRRRSARARAPAPGAGAGYGAAAKYAGYRAAAPARLVGGACRGGMTASWAQPKKKEEAE